MRIQRVVYWFFLFSIVLSVPRVVNYFQYCGSEWYSLNHFLKFELILLVLSWVLSLPTLFEGRLIRFYSSFTFYVVVGYSALELWHVLEFRGFPNSATFFSVFTTNLDESWALIDNLFSWQDLLVIVAFLIGVLTLSRWFDPAKIPWPKTLFLFLLAISIGPFSILAYQNRLAPASFSTTSILGGVNAYLSFLREEDRFTELSKNPIVFEGFRQNREHGNETHVIVIGESTGKHHMGLYGYERNTNPKLSESKNIVVFNNVASSHAHTFAALEKAFSFKSDNQPELSMSDGTILDLLKQGNYRTYWLSNQAISGRFETPISVLAEKADTKLFSKNISGHEQYDENLLDPFSRIISSKEHKVVFIHLMGTHMSYEDRYPEEFDHFSGGISERILTDKQLHYVNTYDNAVRYNDFIVSELIAQLEQINGPCTLLYFSDHGEEVYDLRDFHGHSDVLKSKYMMDVPFFLWANETYQKENPTLMRQASNNQNAPFKTDELIHTLADLYDLHCHKTKHDRSLFSRRIPSNYFHDAPRQCSTSNSINFDKKILCHRVNGIERLNEVKTIFDGFEIDLVYQPDSNKYDVNHPPATSINLALEKLIGSLEEPKKYIFWLDMKNLDSTIDDQAAERLVAIAQTFNIGDRIVVESPRAECLSAFQNKGFHTSLYLPFLQQLSEEEIRVKADSLSSLINTIHPSALSQRFDANEIVKQHFPGADKISWDIGPDYKKDASKKRIEQILEANTDLKLFLVRFETASYR